VADIRQFWFALTDEVPKPMAAQNASGVAARVTCDKAAPAAVVMLHLRARYVSKAAILTIPVQPVPVENRSPA
jgi:hypothetical protein